MSKLPLAALALVTVAAFLAVADFFGLADVPEIVLFAARWGAIAALIAYAVRRRSLTTWILVAMVAGAAIGHDFPDVAVSLRVLSQIFLRLIRTIVAPLLFATLVVGIAGHSSLRQVGRMGIKSLLYFEVVTTLALLIGWAILAAVLAMPAIGAATWPFASAFGLGSAIVATWRARGHRGRHRPGVQVAPAYISEEPMEQEGVGL